MDLLDYLGDSSFNVSPVKADNVKDKQVRLLFRKHNPDKRTRGKKTAGDQKETTLANRTRLQVDRIITLVMQAHEEIKENNSDFKDMQPQWADSKALLKTISNLTALYIVTMHLVDHVFTILPTRAAKEKTYKKKFWELNELCKNIFDKMLGETNHWKLLDKMCRIFEHGNPRKEPGASKYSEGVDLRNRVFTSILKSPKQTYAFVNLPAQEFSPEKYRDNLLDSLNESMKRKTVVRWKRQKVPKTHVLVYKLYLFNKVYKSDSAEKTVLIKSPTHRELGQEKQRHTAILNSVLTNDDSDRRGKNDKLLEDNDKLLEDCDDDLSGETEEDCSNDNEDDPLPRSGSLVFSPILTEHRKHPARVSIITHDEFRTGPYAERLLVLDSSPYSSVKLIQHSTIDLIYVKNFDTISRYLSTQSAESDNLKLGSNSILWIPRECDEIGIDVSVIRGRNNPIPLRCISAISNETFGTWISFLIDNQRASHSTEATSVYDLHFALGVGQNYEIRTSHKKPWSCVLDKPRRFCGISKLEKYDEIHTRGNTLLNSLRQITSVLQSFHDQQVDRPRMIVQHEFCQPLVSLLQMEDFNFTTIKISFATFDDDLPAVPQSRCNSRTKPVDSSACVTLSIALCYQMQTEDKKAQEEDRGEETEGKQVQYGVLSFAAYTDPCVKKYLSRERECSVIKSRIIDLKDSIETIYNKTFPTDHPNPGAALLAPMFSYLDNSQAWNENGTITMRTKYCRELWCSAGVDVVRRIMETISIRDVVLQALLVLLYLNDFHTFREAGDYLIEQYSTIDTQPAFMLVSTMPGSFRDWFMKEYSSKKTLRNAIHAIGTFLLDIDSHITLDENTFRLMVKTMIEYLPGINEVNGQRLAFYAAMAGLIQFNPQNGFLAYPPEKEPTLVEWDNQMNHGGMLYPFSNGTNSSFKLFRLILQYTGVIDDPECRDFRLYRAYDMILEILDCEPNSNTVFRQGQSLYFIVWDNQHQKFVPSRQTFGSKDWVPLPALLLQDDTIL